MDRVGSDILRTVVPVQMLRCRLAGCSSGSRTTPVGGMSVSVSQVCSVPVPGGGQGPRVLPYARQGRGGQHHHERHPVLNCGPFGVCSSVDVV